VAHLVFKTSRAVEPIAWKVRFLRRLVVNVLVFLINREFLINLFCLVGSPGEPSGERTARKGRGMLIRGIEDLRRPLIFLAVTATVVIAYACVALADPGATASSQSFEESLSMEITKKDGSHVAAKGSGSGTIDGTVSLKLHMTSGSKATATFYGHNSHGTLSGTGVAKYSVNGAISSYDGKITTLTGTGRYAGARSRGISISGTVNRRSYKVKMTLSGRWDA
jgi:hypothetical protein